MKRYLVLLLMLALAVSACQPGPAPAATATPALATISALLPTTLAAFHLPAAATPAPSPTPPPTPTPLAHAPYPAPGATLAVSPLPLAPIIGRHVVQPGETLVCIGRAYGVLPDAIAAANGIALFEAAPGQVLQIPAVQWMDMSAGPVCAGQFQSPFPGLLVVTATPQARATPAGRPLTVNLNFACISNCGSKDGDYVVHLELAASGGLAPYGYAPALSYDVWVPHCTTGQGLATITSADGQMAQQGWVYRDVACP